MTLAGIFSGAHGTISVAVTGTDTQKAEFAAITTAYGDAIFQPIGRVEDVEFCVQSELQEYYNLGSREVQQLTPGNVHISGKIGRAYVNGSLLYLLLGRGAKGTAEPTVSPHFNLNLLLRDANDPVDVLRVNIFGVKLENWAMKVPQDTFVMEQVTFKARRIGVLDTDDSNEINVAFPESPA